VVNSGQVVAHFPLDQKLKFAQAYARFDNERDTVAEERNAWQVIVSIATEPTLDDEERRELRHAVGLARTIGQRRRGNGGLILRDSPQLAVDGPAPEFGKGGAPADFCHSMGAPYAEPLADH